MCTRPRKIVQQDRYGKKVVRVVPCGHCPDCLRAYQDGIKLRAYYHYLAYPKAVFFTLTYNRNNIPIVFDLLTGEVLRDSHCDLSPRGVKYNRDVISTVCVSDVQKWLKRGRRRYYYSNPFAGKISYYITSEYGPRSLRSHYHGIMYNISLDDFNKYFRTAWNLGNVDSSALVIDEKHTPMAAMNYVSKYCSKGMFENPRVKEGSVSPTFHLVSNGFGLSALPALRQKVMQGLTNDVYCVSNPFYSPLSFKERRIDEILEVKSRMLDTDDKYNQSEVKSTFLPNQYVKIRTNCPDNIKCLFRHKYKPFSKVIPGNKVIYFPPRQDVIDKICQNLTLSFYDIKKQKSFSYRLPRYYRTYLFGQGTPLQKEVSSYLQTLVSKRMDNEAINRYTASRESSKGFTLEAAYKSVWASAIQTALSREDDFNKNYSQFLSKAKL